jgi:hypothetical protein
MAAVTRGKQSVDNAVAAAAVSGAERERLTAEAAELDRWRQDLERANADAQQAAEALRLAQQARQALPPLEPRHSVPCPHCGGALVVHQVSLVETRIEKAAPVPEGDAKERRRAIAEADGKIAHTNDQVNLARTQAANARAGIERAEAAKERIANWPRAVEAGTDLEASRADLARTEKRLAEFRAKREADDLHAKIQSNDTLLGWLAGDGLRAAKLSRVLQVFQDQQLKALTDAAGWRERVTVDPDMNIGLDGRPYGLLSTSEQYRVRAVLQVAMAILDGSDLVVLDAAEVLDAPTRAGLFEMLERSGVTALVCMTLSRQDRVPDLTAAGFGASFWLSGGVTENLHHAHAA